MGKIVYSLLGIFMMIVIYWFSSCDASISASQSQIIVDLVKTFIPVNSFIIRKLAHFSLFFILEILMYFIFNKSKYLALMIVSLFAISDEVHQYFVPGRSCELRDMLIDISGAICALIIIKLVRWNYDKRTKNSKKNN